MATSSFDINRAREESKKLKEEKERELEAVRTPSNLTRSNSPAGASEEDFPQHQGAAGLAPQLHRTETIMSDPEKFKDINTHIKDALSGWDPSTDNYTKLLDFLNQEVTFPMNVLVVGMQHQGKSSFCNTIFRIVQGKHNQPWFALFFAADSTDQERTVKYKGLRLSKYITIFDTPAMHEGSEKRKNELRCLLSGVETGCERDEYASYPQPENKIHGVIVVVRAISLYTGEGNPADVMKNLCKVLRDAAVLYVVALTGIDEIANGHLMFPDGKPRPPPKVEDVVRLAKQACNCDIAIPLINYTSDNHKERRIKDTDQPVIELLCRLAQNLHISKQEDIPGVQVTSQAVFSSWVRMKQNWVSIASAILVVLCAILFASL